MYIIRPLTLNDLETFVKFAFMARQGMASMPRNRELLRKKIERSVESMAKEISTPRNEAYLFALEDTATKQIGGVCGIYSKIGVEYPHYGFQVHTVHKPKTPLPAPTEIQVLRTCIYVNGPSEIGTLYLDPDHRKGGLGRLLSLCRFLFMAVFPQRFEETVIARMRGYFDPEERSPFYEQVTSHFIKLDRDSWRVLIDNASHFPTIIPDFPIYIFLLPKEAQNTIGAIHPNTQPAMAMLKQEGFLVTDEVDFFDAGPKIRAVRSHIRTIKESRTTTLATISR